PWKKNPAILERLEELLQELKANGIRAMIDDSDNSPGFKFNEWELRGVPMRIEFGPRDLENNHVMVKMRDKDGKEAISLNEIVSHIPTALDHMQARLLESARENRKQ